MIKGGVKHMKKKYVIGCTIAVLAAVLGAAAIRKLTKEV